MQPQILELNSPVLISEAPVWINHAYPVGCQKDILALNLANGSRWLPDDTSRVPEGIPG